jgi:DNA primase
MKVHQAGYPNAVGTLGGHVSPFKMQLLNRYFDHIVIMTDADEAGRKLGQQIADGFSREVSWVLYPDNVKDAGDMTDEQVNDVIKNAVNNIEYQMMVQ